MSGRFATLTFEREVDAPLRVLWQVWTQPAARAVWAAPSDSLSVEFVEAETSVGGREVSLCRVERQPDIRCEVRWLALEPGLRSVTSEVVSSEGETRAAALVTAEFAAAGEGSRVTVTVQLASLAGDMEADYREGFDAGLDNLAGVAARTMVLERVIRAPRPLVWGAWLDPETLPRWWGPDGFYCRTTRIDLRSGGEWVFDMVAPDGTVFPNHHLYGEIRPQERLGYTLLRGENGPKHADAWATFEDRGEETKVTLGMVFTTAAEFHEAKGFGAEALGQQTLAKLGRFALTGRAEEGAASDG